MNLLLRRRKFIRRRRKSSSDYFSIEVITDGNFKWYFPSYDRLTIYYRIDDSDWQSFTYSTGGSNQLNIPNLTAGQIVSFKGTNTLYDYHDPDNIGAIRFTGTFNVKGNIRSLIEGDNFGTTGTIASEAFRSLFANNTGLINAKDLKICATEINTRSCISMFDGCTNLITAPSIPALSVGERGYEMMFRNCVSLTSTPELPALTLGQRAYNAMFKGCSNLVNPAQLPCTNLSSDVYGAMFMNCVNLVTAPVLPALTLVNGCYNNMFEGCSSLNYIKALFTTAITSSTSYTTDWVKNVASNGTFVKNSSATWNLTGNNGTPTGWTIETENS